jgi:hypothetical protein
MEFCDRMVRSSVYNKLDLSDLFGKINLGGASEAALGA